MVSNKSVVFAKVPTGIPTVGEHLIIHDSEFDLGQQPSHGGFIAKVLHASLEPALRFQLVSPDKPREFPPLPLGSTIVNACVIRVVKSSKGCPFSEEDYLIGDAPFQQYISILAKDAFRFKKIKNPFGLDLRLFLGPLGTSGFAAYAAFYGVVKPKKGETIFISAASGAVGQIVGQLALREGLTVIGSVGNDSKLKVITNDLKFHAGINYNAANVLGELGRLAPNGIDIYFDNVGGPQLDAAICALRSSGRIVACGYASQYNSDPAQQYGIRNTGLVVMKEITWKGFLAHQYLEEYERRHQEEMQRWINEGEIKPVLDVVRGIENGPAALVKLFKGENRGKSILSME